MLIINYKGITPQNRFYNLGVRGDSKSNIISFIVQSEQEDVVLSELSAYLKVQNKEHDYIDKIELNGVFDEDSGLITLNWEMTRKSTQYRNLELQLVFEDSDNDILWQTQIVELELSNTIEADKEISEKCPTILEQLEKLIKDIEAHAEIITTMVYFEDELTIQTENAKGEIHTHKVNIPTSDKVVKTNSANKVYGTDNQGNQITYDKDDFGKVDDVKVNGTSVVSDKVANIDLTPYEEKANKTTSISQNSTDTQYPSAKAVYDFIQAYKRNAFQEVDTTEYPTLEDFLASTGEEGYIYLYPLDINDLSKGYHQYIWEDSKNTWVFMGDTNLDLTHYPRKDQDETITGNWTFSDGILFDANTKIYKDASNRLAFYVNGEIKWLVLTDGTLRPYNGNFNDIGTLYSKIRDLYINGKLKNNNATYGITQPDMTSWTADKEIATTDQIDYIVLKDHTQFGALTGGEVYKMRNGGFVPTFASFNGNQRQGIFMQLTYISGTSYKANGWFLDSSRNLYIYEGTINNVAENSSTNVSYSGFVETKVIDIPKQEQVLNVINASDIGSGNVLTQAQYDLITNGKKTRIIGGFGGYPYVELRQPTDRNGSDTKMVGIAICQSNGQSCQYMPYEINKSTLVLSLTTSTGVDYEQNEVRLLNLKRVNGKQVPNYPNNPTQPKVLTYGTDNTMSWGDIPLNVLNAPASTTLTQSEYDVFTNGKPTQIIGTFLTYKNPFFMPIQISGTSIYRAFAFSGTEQFVFAINPNDLTMSLVSASQKIASLRSIWGFNGKEVPAYQTDTTKKYNIVQQVGGTLAWEDSVDVVKLDTGTYTSGTPMSANDLAFFQPIYDMNIEEVMRYLSHKLFMCIDSSRNETQTTNYFIVRASGQGFDRNWYDVKIVFGNFGTITVSKSNLQNGTY